MTTGFVIGTLATIVVRDYWSRFLAAGRWVRWQWHRLLSRGADDQSTGLPRLPWVERQLAAAAMRNPTAEFHAMVGLAWAPSVDDVWGDAP